MTPPDALAPEFYRRFAGCEKLTDFFGYWPGFHDVEILSFHLERGSPAQQEDGPVLTVLLHTFEWGQDTDSGATILTRHCTVEFCFTQVDDLHAAGVDTRNVISELRFNADARETPPRWLVAFPGTQGLSGQFSCGSVEVKAVTPGIPPDSIYHA